MIRKYLLPFLALCGVIFAIYTVRAGQKPVPAAQPVTQPSHSPFAQYVAGAGLIEASTENIAVSTTVPGVVTKLFVAIGDRVKAGDPLFTVDDRDLQAELIVKKAALESTRRKLARLESLPRPEDIPPAQARVTSAEAAVHSTEVTLADAQDTLKLREAAGAGGAVSIDELNRKRAAVSYAQSKLAEARSLLVQSQSELALLKAGTWKPDIEVAQADIVSAEAQVKTTETSIERLTVRAPVDGQVMQVKIRLGEFAPTGVLAQPLMLLGNVDTLNVRVDVDENDAWRINPDSQAIAYLRGNRELNTRLKFVRIEPYVIPKKSLTGDSTERVDTRVLQVIYSFPRQSLKAYVGQQVDVFIETGDSTKAVARE